MYAYDISSINYAYMHSINIAQIHKYSSIVTALLNYIYIYIYMHVCVYDRIRKIINYLNTFVIQY